VSGERLDRRLRALHPDLSWTRIRNAIERGQVTVDDVIARDPALAVGRSSVVDYHASRPALPTARLDLSLLYEDDEILVIDKPAGLLTIASDPESRATEDTVLRRVQEYARRLHGRKGYAGVLHRLDRGTSGALAVALSQNAHRAGRALFAAHAFERWYLAIVEGAPRRDRGTIEALISNDYVSGRRRVVQDEREGRHAVTHYQVRERFQRAALLELQLETGRQHQIRLHLQQLGHPIVGESVYVTAPGTGVGARRVTRPLLHAWRLTFPHPLHEGTVHAEAPLPPDFDRVLKELRRVLPS
jgi:23S rRNA pseudouridine1911/1915/1917 synthase